MTGIDYTAYFKSVLANKAPRPIAKSLAARRQYVSLFYQYRVPDQRFLAKAKLFFEKEFIVDLSNEIGRKIFEDSFFEPETSNYLYNHIKAGDVFIDCGAAEGYYSFLAAHKLEGTGQVIAYEMNPDICDVFNINNACFPNLTLHQMAITDDGRDLTFNFYGRSYSPYSTIVDTPRFDVPDLKPTKISTKSTTLQAILQQIAPLPGPQNNLWIKMDLEGAEYDVLAACMDLVVKMKAKLIVEIGFNREATEKLISLFRAHNLSLYEMALKKTEQVTNFDKFDYVGVRNILACHA